MGFWDTVGKIASSAMNEVKEAGERTKVYKEEMLSKSENELARIIKQDRSSSPLRAGAAMGELRNRGYDDDRIRSLVRNA